MGRSLPSVFLIYSRGITPVSRGEEALPGLDSKCTRIFLVLLKDSERAALTVEKLSVRSRLASRAVRYHLKHLIEEGLVQESQSDWGNLYSLKEGFPEAS